MFIEDYVCKIKFVGAVPKGIRNPCIIGSQKLPYSVFQISNSAEIWFPNDRYAVIDIYLTTGKILMSASKVDLPLYLETKENFTDERHSEQIKITDLNDKELEDMTGVILRLVKKLIPKIEESFKLSVDKLKVLTNGN